MPDIALILGPIVLKDFEVSAGICFGGQQRLAVHQLPTGQRVIDALGRDDAEIVITGIFSGQDATLRARALDEMRSLGATVPLTWDVFFYSVVIRDLQADYQNAYWIPYRLTCTVLRDEASALIETVLSVAGSILADIGTAAGQALAGIDLSGVQSALAAPGSTTLGTLANNQAMTSLGTSQAAIDGSLTQANDLLASSASTLSTTSDATAGSAAFLTTTAAAGQLSALATMRGYVGRAAANLANVST